MSDCLMFAVLFACYGVISMPTWPRRPAGPSSTSATTNPAQRPI
ncbi:hypothetical protein [Paracoccus mutanolyticus]|nr:hypothetical protein [Paracoccus mutanolyticus]